MPIDIFSAESAQRSALDLGWSLWTELGVSGQRRSHSKVGVDLEPLIVTTAYLSRFDARLRDESLDWCVLNVRYVSSDRLRNFLRTVDETLRQPFGHYSATVKKAKRVSWPEDGRPFAFSPTGRSGAPDLLRPALVQLRLRAAFGVSARAEVLRWLLNQPEHFVGSLELALKSHYGKDNVADTLDLLARAGLLQETVMTNAGNQRVFRLDRQAGIVSALTDWAKVPQQRWDAIFRTVVRLIEFAQTAPAKPPARAVAIQEMLADIQSDLRWLGIFPRLRQGVDAVNHDFDRWATTALQNWAGQASL
jgi:hypothetical protein